VFISAKIARGRAFGVAPSHRYNIGIYARETGRGPDKGWKCIGCKSNDIDEQGVITKTARESGTGQ
jgi:hypothetical protein